MRQLANRKQKGFTLIELIIVIIILGILAVTAAPKFLDIQSDAQVSAMSGIAGAVRSSSQIARSAFLMNKVDGNGNILLEGVAYTPSHGFIAASEICRTIGLTNSVTTSVGPVGSIVEDADPANATTISDDGGYGCWLIEGDNNVVTIRPIADSADATCQVTYTDRGDQGGDASGTAPVISSVTTGC